MSRNPTSINARMAKSFGSVQPPPGCFNPIGATRKSENAPERTYAAAKEDAATARPPTTIIITNKDLRKIMKAMIFRAVITKTIVPDRKKFSNTISGSTEWLGLVQSGISLEWARF
jgi:hypothetical protein